MSFTKIKIYNNVLNYVTKSNYQLTVQIRIIFKFTILDILLIAKKKTGRMGGMIRSPSNMSIASGHVSLQTKVRVLRT